MSGQWERAIGHYTRAVDLGERHPRTLRRLLALLLERRMYVPAEQVLAKAEEQGPLPADLARLGAEIALANKNHARVRQLARQAVPAASRDYRDLLWLARMHRGLDEPTKAEALLRKAVQVAEHVPDTWIALAELLARTNQRGAAQAVVDQVAAKMPAGRVAFTLVRCYDAMGDFAKAVEWYAKVLAEQPRDFVILAAAADFYRHADRLAEAEPLLERLAHPSSGATPDLVAAARRYQALYWASHGNLTRAQAALELNGKDFGPLAADERVRLYVAGLRPSERTRSIEALKDSFRRHPSHAEEELLLAGLYEAGSDLVRARELLSQLVSTHETPQILAQYVRVLLKLDQASDAVPYFARLDALGARQPADAGAQAALVAIAQQVTANHFAAA